MVMNDDDADDGGAHDDGDLDAEFAAAQERLDLPLAKLQDPEDCEWDWRPQRGRKSAQGKRKSAEVTAEAC
eukprot:10263068-Karenia_brevis.AAC.1